MKELGYHLNYNARVLAQQKTRTIGVVMKKSASDSLHDPFFPEVLRGISAYCNKEDYSITLTTGESEEEIFDDVVNMVRGKRVDGMIVTYSKRDDKVIDRKSTRLNSSHVAISYAVFCLKQKKKQKYNIEH